MAGLTEGQTGTQAVEELAGMVWNFVNAAGGLVQDLDSEVGSLFPKPLDCVHGSHRD